LQNSRCKAVLTGIDRERVGSGPSDLDPTARPERTRASGGGRTGRGGELAGATPNRARVHDSERGLH
jgi:hypothetical protein